MAEVVERVPSTNKAPNRRVDFFCYKLNGDVVRCHPGCSRTADMTPHCMPLGSLCFHMHDAAQHGVGASLHAQPPRTVLRSARAGHPPLSTLASLRLGAAHPHLQFLATREDLDLLCVYDVQQVSWTAVREALRVLPDRDHTVDWCDGSHFPWWVWLANKGRLRNVVHDGVVGVCLEVAGGNKCVVVHSVRGTFRLSAHPDDGRMMIKPAPPRYDPC